MCRLGLIGGTGKLGQAIKQLCAARSCQVVMEASSTTWNVAERPDVVIDVSDVAAFPRVIEFCLDWGVPLVEGTSGLGEGELSRLRSLATTLPILRAQNFAFGSYVQRRLTSAVATVSATRAISTTIIDRHPVTKKDRPSATALMLGDIWSQAKGALVNDIASVRGGAAVSDHTVLVSFNGETLEVKHSVQERSAAASGAIDGALWLKNKSAPGYWGMDDVYDELR